MTGHAFHAMGTEWWVETAEPTDGRRAEVLVRDLESRLSRFLPDSALSRLNRARKVEDPYLADVVRRALGVRAATGGAFEPGVGDDVIAAGYAVSFADLPAMVSARPPSRARPNIVVSGDTVALEGAGLLDLGGIAKGYAVDRVCGLFDGAFLVDGGGDIRVSGPDPWPIGVPGDRTVLLRDGAIATSSSERRRWRTEHGVAHHIVDARTGRSAAGVTTAVVIAGDATTADALATALIADCATAVPALAVYAAHALVHQGAWWMTPGTEERLC